MFYNSREFENGYLRVMYAEGGNVGVESDGHLRVMYAETGNVGVESDGHHVQGAGGAGHQQ